MVCGNSLLAYRMYMSKEQANFFYPQKCVVRNIQVKRMFRSRVWNKADSEAGLRQDKPCAESATEPDVNCIGLKHYWAYPSETSVQEPFT